MRTGLRLLLITLPIAAIGAGILAYVVSNSPPPERIDLAERAKAVRVVIAESHAVTPTYTGFGFVRPVHTFDAIAEVGGTVEYVNPALQDGQILPADTVLLRLSPTDFNLAIAQANANIRSAGARLAELDVSEENQRAALAIEQEVLAVKASDLTRSETLFAAGTVPQNALDAARAAHLAQRQKVQGILGTLALFPTQRAVQTEQIAVYQTQLTTAEINLSRSELTLPFAARVAEHSVEVGQYLKAGQTAASLDGIERAEVELQLPMERFRALLRAGQPFSADLPMDPSRMTQSLQELGLMAEVRLNLGDETVRWTATVDRISDGIDQKIGTVGIVVQIEDAYGKTGDGGQPPLTKGMFVDVVLTTHPINGIALPRSAMADGQVFVADADNRLRMIPASPRLVQGDIAVFTDEIAVGTRVVLSPPSPVVSGLLLDPHPDEAVMTELLNKDAGQ